MTNTPQCYKGDYAQLRFAPSRGVCQIIIEIPLEEGTAFVAAFGTPLPKSGIPIALARINKEAVKPTEPETKPAPETKTDKAKRKWDELSIAQQAGIMCQEKGFQVFVGERLVKTNDKRFGQDEITAEDAATYVRMLCGVNSRAHIEDKPEALRIFKDLDASYRAWLVAS